LKVEFKFRKYLIGTAIPLILIGITKYNFTHMGTIHLILPYPQVYPYTYRLEGQDIKLTPQD